MHHSHIWWFFFTLFWLANLVYIAPIAWQLVLIPYDAVTRLFKRKGKLNGF